MFVRTINFTIIELLKRFINCLVSFDGELVLTKCCMKFLKKVPKAERFFFDYLLKRFSHSNLCYHICIVISCKTYYNK